ncbi:MAG TPA: hydrogenase maturation nickel metallochaperone HypA [Nitrososphaerales archaeon]|nr:hydrogenase maturation nickel metallochaperone HypA [Nitrososphaerales archaeon]
MHEYVYADRILQSVLEVRGSGSPKSVKVEVGEMLGLTKESLTMAYGILSKGTRAEGSKLEIVFTEGSVECPRCGYAGRLKLRRHEHAVDPAFACPECGSSLRVVKGLEVRLVEVR